MHVSAGFPIPSKTTQSLHAFMVAFPEKEKEKNIPKK